MQPCNFGTKNAPDKSITQFLKTRELYTIPKCSGGTKHLHKYSQQSRPTILLFTTSTVHCTGDTNRQMAYLIKAKLMYIYFLKAFNSVHVVVN